MGSDTNVDEEDNQDIDDPTENKFIFTSANCERK